MSTEPKPAKIYKRTAFDKDTHCGGPVDRTMDTLSGKRDKYERKIADYQANPNITEKEKKYVSVLQRRLSFTLVKINKIERYGPDERPCMNKKGFKTSHPGSGLCSFHCDCKGRANFHLTNKFSYSKRAVSKRLSAIIDEMEAAGHDLLNLEPDVVLLRGYIRLFVESKNDLDPETIKSLTSLSEQLRKNIETINNKKFKSMITMEMFQMLMYRMGEVVSKLVNDPEVLQRITDEWQKISMDTREKQTRASLASAGEG